MFSFRKNYETEKQFGGVKIMNFEKYIFVDFQKKKTSEKTRIFRTRRFRIFSHFTFLLIFGRLAYFSEMPTFKF